MKKEELIDAIEEKETPTQERRRLKEEKHKELIAKSNAIIRKEYKQTTNKKGVDAGIIRKQDKIGRNDLCPCGSGKKYKKCCVNANIS